MLVADKNIYNCTLLAAKAMREATISAAAVDASFIDDEHYDHYESRQTTCSTFPIPTDLELVRYNQLQSATGGTGLTAYLGNTSTCDGDDGYTGPLCATCLPEWGIHNNACWRCAELIEDVKDALGYILILGIVLTAVGVFCSWMLKFEVAASALPRYLKSSGVQTLASLKILLTAVQMYNLLTNTFPRGESRHLLYVLSCSGCLLVLCCCSGAVLA